MNIQVRPADWEDPVRLPQVELPRRLLVPFDGSHNSERALAWAAATAGVTNGEVVVLVGFEQPLTMRGRGAAYIESVREELESEARELAAEAVQLLADRGVRARGIVVKGDVPHAILDVVDAEACDLLVIGRQGLSAEVGGMASALDRVRDMLQGGVSDKVVRHSPVPVLVVSYLQGRYKRKLQDQLPDAFYLIGGAELTGAPGPPVGRRFLKDVCRYRAGQGWDRLPDLPAASSAGYAVMDGADVVVMGGNDGEYADREFEVKDNHPGFPLHVFRLKPGAKAWSPSGKLPSSLVTSGLTRWGDEVVIAGGEDRPGHRSARVVAGRFGH